MYKNSCTGEGPSQGMSSSQEATELNRAKHYSYHPLLLPLLATAAAGPWHWPYPLPTDGWGVIWGQAGWGRGCGRLSTAGCTLSSLCGGVAPGPGPHCCLCGKGSTGTKLHGGLFLATSVEGGTDCSPPLQKGHGTGPVAPDWPHQTGRLSPVALDLPTSPAWRCIHSPFLRSVSPRPSQQL